MGFMILINLKRFKKTLEKINEENIKSLNKDILDSLRKLIRKCIEILLHE